MGFNPFIGVLYHWIGGFASATTFIPFRRIRRWSWEVYWLVQGVAAWIVAPLLIALLLVPHLFRVLAASPRSALSYALLFGALWGFGGLTFGLAIRYLGIALGYAIALGLCTAFGTLIPPVYSGKIHVIMHDRSGQLILAGIAVCLLAVAVNGAAGWFKEREKAHGDESEAGERDFNLSKGLIVAVFAGIMSSFFAYGLSAGAPIAEIARASLIAEGHLPLWQNLPVLVVVLSGGFATNLVWTLGVMVKRHSFAQFTGTPDRNPMRAATPDMEHEANNAGETAPRLSGGALTRNYLFAALAGCIWYLQFFFYSLGQAEMGQYDFSSWTLHMASIILFATLWGLALNEWSGTSKKTRTLVALGLTLLIGSTLLVGYGDYRKTREDAPAVTFLR